MALRISSRSETGFAIIEAVVSAAVLAIVAMAVLSGIDAAGGSSAREKARAVASNLAEQDQERLRTMSVDSLSKLGAKTRPVPVEGVNYKVESKAEWITDDTGGTPSCGNSSKNNEYFHITSTVTSSIVGVRIPAVRIDSLVAPSMEYSSTHGVLGVKVVDRDGNPLQGVPVSATTPGPPAFSPPGANTDAGGCVIYRQVPVGTYTITLGSSGYVGTELELPTKDTQKVSAGVVTFKTITYDRATSANVAVKTNAPGTPGTPAAPPTLQDSRATAISATNPRRAGKIKTWANTAPSNPYTASPLFPFKSDAYSFFTGSCLYESPSTTSGSNYFSSYPGSLIADYTKPQPQPVTVRQPPFNLRIDKSADGDATFTTANVQVYATLKKPAAGDSCSEGRVQMAFKAWPVPVGTWGNAPVSGGNWVVQSTTAFDPGMPFGTYTICIVDKEPNPSDKYLTFDYDNTTPGGPTTTKLSSTLASAQGASWKTTSC